MSYNFTMEEFPPVVREFASYKTAIQGCSQKTSDEYLLDLRTFFRYLLAKDRGIDPDSDEFCEIDISSVSIEFFARVIFTFSTVISNTLPAPAEEESS